MLKTEIIVVLVLLTIFVLVMITFIIMMIFNLQKKQEGFLSDLKAVRINYEKELYKAQLEIQEQTFQDISRELHDNVGQVLTVAKLGTGAIDFENKMEAKRSLDEVGKYLGDAINELRHLARSLNNEVIKNSGLKKSIENQVLFIQRSKNFQIDFEVAGEIIKIDPTKEILIFRIVQEAINNIIKHAAATEIWINLAYNSNSLNLIIKDNGRGFIMNAENSAMNNINGLQNMHHRANLINADFKIESELGKGTTINLKAPY